MAAKHHLLPPAKAEVSDNMRRQKQNEKKLKTIKKRIQIDFILEEKNRDEENPYVYTISDFKIEERETNS